MKKRTIFTVLLFLLLFSQTAVAFEEETGNYFFGIGATVKKAEEDVHIVKTKGEKIGEGFVHTPKISSYDGEINYQIDLKGKGTVYLKIEETDSRGKFLKEHISAPFELIDEWKTYSLKIELTPDASQIDVLVVTTEKEKAEFQFKNLKITKP